MEFLGGGSQAAQHQQTQQGGIVSGIGGTASSATSHHHLDSNGGGGGGSQSSSSVYGGGGYGGGMVMDFGIAGVMMMSSSNNSSVRHGGGSGASSSSDSDGGSGFDINMSSLNADSTLLAESLDAFLSYADEEQSKQVPLPQYQIQQQMQPAPPLMQQHQQQAVATTSTVTMAHSSTVNNLFSFQLGLVAAAGTSGMPQQPLPFFAVAPVSATNIASLLAGRGASSGATSSSMAAPPPPPAPSAAKSASAKRVSTTTKSIAAVTTTATSSSATASAPLVPTLFGRAVSLPPVSGPSRPLQLSPWEIEQAKKQKSSAGARGGVSAAAAAASSSCSPVATTTTPHLSLSQMQQTRNAAKKRPRHAADEGGGDDGISAVSEDERRQDRNQREQNRSQQITHQIAHLRNVLAAANVPFKPDKHSTLVSVVQYIKELQEQSKGLDEEHDKLLQTITNTTEIMNNQYLPAQTTGTGVPTLEDTSGVNKPATSTSASSVARDPTLSLLQGVDFKFIFQRCPVASAVTSIDGRFLDFNGQFEQICGFERQELLVASEPPNEDEKAADAAHTTTVQPSPAAAATATKNLSLFNILQQSDMERVYSAMSHMLQRPMFMNNSDKKSDSKVSDDMWTEQVSLCRMDKAEVRLTLSLVRSPQEGRPRFFNCVLIAKESD